MNSDLTPSSDPNDQSSRARADSVLGEDGSAAAGLESGNCDLPGELSVRQAFPDDAQAIHALMRPFVSQRLLLSRTEAEIIELSRHGFVAMMKQSQSALRCVGFAAVEVYSQKLAELQCLAVHPDYQRFGLGKELVSRCVQRAGDLGVMEVMAISSSERFLQSCGFDYSLPDQKKALFMQLRPRPYQD